MPHRASPITTSATLSRRLVLGGLLGAAGAAALPALPAARADAATHRVGDHVRAAFLAGGGTDLLGRAVAGEVRRRIDSHRTYGQRFAQGTVWSGSGVGKIDLPATSRVRLDTAQNFRPVRGVVAVWRSDDLDHCTALEERIVHDLGVTTMVAMNSGSDPTISGVRRQKFHISNSGSHLECYRGYVVRDANRRAAGEVLRAVAKSGEPVLVHCSAGKDRTGWVSDLLQAVAGVPLDVRDADYLATRDYSNGQVELAWLQAARSQLVADYGTVMSYLTNGCGLSTTRYSALRARLTT